MRDYLRSTRHPWACLLFLVPLLFAYELGLVWLGGTWRANRCLWGWVALISLGLAGLALACRWSHVPTVENRGAVVLFRNGQGGIVLPPVQEKAILQEQM